MKTARRSKSGLRFYQYVFIVLVYLFIYLPIFSVVLYSFNKNPDNMKFVGFTFDYYGKALSGGPLLESMWTSVILALCAMAVSVVIGTLATIGMYRYEFRLKKYINALLYIPLVIPELVIGIASLTAFSKMGVPMGFISMLFAHVTFCIPFVIITLRARIADFDRSVEEAAMDLGANRWRTLWRVTLPMLAPGIGAGALMSISLSIDDVIISSFLTAAGQDTFPVNIYARARSKTTTDIYAISTMLMVAVVLIVVAYYIIKRIWRKKHPD
ncbi:MAG: ABC transporter permease [Clostridia bacterium]|nr:ABC transporter permease [Clostridia bacterium]